MFELNDANFEAIQIVESLALNIGAVMFVYKDKARLRGDNELYVPLSQLYHKAKAEPVDVSKGKGVRFSPSSSSSTSSSPRGSSVAPLKPALKSAAVDHLYVPVNHEQIKGLQILTLPFDTNTENLYFSNNSPLYEIPNVYSVEPIVGSDDSVEVTQINNEGIPVKIQYDIVLLFQAPKNDDKLLRANLQKIFNDLKDSGEREVAAGLQQPTPSQIQSDKFNAIMGNESIGDLAERYNVYLKSVSEPSKSEVEVNITKPINDITQYDSNTFNKRFYNLYAREREGGTYKTYQLKNIIDVIPQKDNSIRVTLRKNDGSIYIKNFFVF